ncbi:hypothetical protein Aperf_G00000118686 [Anoplocephala perfoliata]
MYHLGQGDSEPQITSEKITLYYCKFCPFCQRVRYTLGYHQIQYDSILINLINKPDWYLRLNPAGRVPFLRYRGEKLADSEKLIRFVDQLNGKSKTSLLNVCGEEALKNAFSLSEGLSKPRHMIVYEKGSAGDVKEFLDACGKVDDAIKGRYLCGDKVSLADMALAPFLNGWKCVTDRITAITPENTEVSIAAAYPKLTAYRKIMAEEPYTKANTFSDDEFCKYVEIFHAKDTSARF